MGKKPLRDQDTPYYRKCARIARGNIRARREQLDLSQREFAKQVGVSQSRITALESGFVAKGKECKLTFMSLCNIAKALKVPVHSLLIRGEYDSPPKRSRR